MLDEPLQFTNSFSALEMEAEKRSRAKYKRYSDILALLAAELREEDMQQTCELLQIQMQVLQQLQQGKSAAQASTCLQSFALASSLFSKPQIHDGVDDKLARIERKVNLVLENQKSNTKLSYRQALASSKEGSISSSSSSPDLSPCTRITT